MSSNQKQKSSTIIFVGNHICHFLSVAVKQHDLLAGLWKGDAELLISCIQRLSGKEI
jgi:hypothetical protein